MAQYSAIGFTGEHTAVQVYGWVHSQHEGKRLETPWGNAICGSVAQSTSSFFEKRNTDACWLSARMLLEVHRRSFGTERNHALSPEIWAIAMAHGPLQWPYVIRGTIIGRTYSCSFPFLRFVSTFHSSVCRTSPLTGGIGFQVRSNQIRFVKPYVLAPKYRTEAHRTSK